MSSRGTRHAVLNRVFPRALTLYRSTLGEQRFSGKDVVVVVVFVVRVFDGGRLPISGVD